MIAAIIRLAPIIIVAVALIIVTHFQVSALAAIAFICVIIAYCIYGEGGHA